MKRSLWITAVLIFGCAQALAAEKADTLDDFLSNPARVKDIKAFCMILASQTDPAMGPRNAAEIRKTFWAARPDAKLTDAEREFELKRFDTDWKRLAEVIKDRNMVQVYFCGVDNIMPVRKAQYWYFCGFTPRGPVLIRIATQYEPGPPTLHGVAVWTNWDEIKAVSRAVEVPAGDKVFSFTYEKQGSPTTAPAKSDDE